MTASLIIDLIVKMILDYLNMTVHIPQCLLLLQIYREVFCERSPLKLLNKILEKKLFSEVAGLKTSSIYHSSSIK